MDYQLTIIVPLYNEEENLLRIEKTLSEYLRKAPLKCCVLFVDDGSKDHSLNLILEICGRSEDFKFISLSENRGLSTALKAGFDHSRTPWIGYLDADLQTDPEDFDLLLEHKEHFDLITGIRTDRKDSFKKKFSSFVANRIRRSFTGDGMDDTGCPLKIIRSTTAKSIPMFKGLHRFLPAMVLLQGGRVKQVPVRHYSRIAGKSKYHLFNRLLGPLIDCFIFLWMKSNYINYKVKKSNV